MYDVAPNQFASVIRDLIKHENDVTNHRIMWLLIGQGLLLNAYVIERKEPLAARGVVLAGILVALSAFVLLYKSYHARGYLNFLGNEAKQGKLPEQYLRLDGWPKKRIKDWRRDNWMCPWLEQMSDMLEPYLSLPALIVTAWAFLLLEGWTTLPTVTNLIDAILAAAFVLSAFCIFWVRSQNRDEEERDESR
jgi:FtsH-binding integral membrane protein